LETFINHLYSNFGYAGILIAMAIESCCIPLPSEIIMPLAGFMTVAAAGHTAKFSLLGVTLVGAVGSVVGSIIAYWIGYSGGRELLLRYGKFVLISHRDAERADRFFAKRGDITVFISRMLPVVRTFISLPAGITRMRFGHFVVLTFLGSLPWCLLLAYIGRQLGKNWKDLGPWFQRFDVLIILAVVVLVALYVWRHIHESREVEAA